MEKNNKKVVILIVLTLCAIASLTYGLTYSPRKRPLKASFSKLSGRIRGSLERSSLQGIPIRHAKKSNYDSWGRSPFGKVVLEEKSDALTLNGIIWDTESPYAIINNEAVHVGSVINGAEVISIEVDKVQLNSGTEEIELRLEE